MIKKALIGILIIIDVVYIFNYMKWKNEVRSMTRAAELYQYNFNLAKGEDQFGGEALTDLRMIKNELKLKLIGCENIKD